MQVGARLMECIQQLSPATKPQYGVLDITFYRDDVREELHVASTTDIPFSIEGKKVVLIDDVLYTGRTMTAAQRIAFGPFLGLGIWLVWIWGPITT